MGGGDLLVLCSQSLVDETKLNVKRTLCLESKLATFISLFYPCEKYGNDGWNVTVA